MRAYLFSAVLLAAACLGAASRFTQESVMFQNDTNKEGRMFSLFSSLTDSNDDQTCSNNVNSGVCVSSSRCKSKGGTTISGGSCSNNRVCCQVIANCTSNANQDPVEPCIIRYSATVVTQETGMAMYRRIYRYRRPKRVCQVRLDFDEFMLAGPDDSGACATDIMQVEGQSICGANRGQHLYLDYGTRTFIDASIRIREQNSRFSIRNTYIPCNSDRLAPPDCLQYYRALEGTVRSFNFIQDPTANNRQTNNLEYSVCVRAAEGMNRIEWRPCTNVDNPFFISGGGLGTGPLTSPNCNRDFVQIYGLPQYCGNGFVSVTSAAKPFLMNVRFDQTEGFGVTLPTDPSGCTGQVIQDPYTGGFITCPVPLPGETTCTCELTVPEIDLPVGQIPYVPDLDNTGFCLEYLQMS